MGHYDELESESTARIEDRNQASHRRQNFRQLKERVAKLEAELASEKAKNWAIKQNGHDRTFARLNRKVKALRRDGRCLQPAAIELAQRISGRKWPSNREDAVELAKHVLDEPSLWAQVAPVLAAALKAQRFRFGKALLPGRTEAVQELHAALDGLPAGVREAVGPLCGECGKILRGPDGPCECCGAPR